jgi:hypothetical protein
VRIEVFANGKLVGTATGSSAYINWNTAKRSKGTLTVTALAYDAAGYVGTAPAVRVSRSSGPPGKDASQGARRKPRPSHFQ